MNQVQRAGVAMAMLACIWGSCLYLAVPKGAMPSASNFTQICMAVVGK